MFAVARSWQVLRHGRQIGEGAKDVVGCAVGVVVGAGQVLARLDQDPGDPLALGGEHVGLDVITHHQGVRGGPRCARAVAKNAAAGLPTTSAPQPRRPGMPKGPRGRDDRLYRNPGVSCL